jgi:hypothetical protein
MAETTGVAPTRSCVKGTVSVRIEDETSIGRSYSKKAEVVPGLGAKRKALREATWRTHYAAEPVTLESYTLAKTQLSQCTKEDLLAYFRNTWDITTALFCNLKDDSQFYAVPDKLRRPLIFYVAHPAALYVNKMHQAGLMGTLHARHMRTALPMRNTHM